MRRRYRAEEWRTHRSYEFLKKTVPEVEDDRLIIMDKCKQIGKLRQDDPRWVLDTDMEHQEEQLRGDTQLRELLEVEIELEQMLALMDKFLREAEWVKWGTRVDFYKMLMTLNSKLESSARIFTTIDGCILSTILKGMRNNHYIATSELLYELSKKEFTVPVNLVEDLSNLTIKQLHNHHISKIAVKCLRLLVTKISGRRILTIIDNLLNRLFKRKAENRDIDLLALNTILDGLPTSYARHIVDSIFEKLVQGILLEETNTPVSTSLPDPDSSLRDDAGTLEETNTAVTTSLPDPDSSLRDDAGALEETNTAVTTSSLGPDSSLCYDACALEEIVGGSLEILGNILHKYGDLIEFDHKYILGKVLPGLSSKISGVVGKTATFIVSIASSLSDVLLTVAVNKVVEVLKSKATNTDCRITCIHLGLIGSLSRAVGYRFGPHLGNIVPILTGHCHGSEDEIEIREYSLQALKTILLMCSGDISSYCDEILDIVLDCLRYHSGYSDDTDDDGDFQEDVYLSQRVRVAAAKCLATFIASRREQLLKVYMKACPILIDILKREENTEKHVFSVLFDLITETGKVTKLHMCSDDLSPIFLLRKYMSKIVTALNEQLPEKKSIATKVGALSVLKEMTIVLRDDVAQHIAHREELYKKRRKELDEKRRKELDERRRKELDEKLREELDERRDEELDEKRDEELDEKRDEELDEKREVIANIEQIICDESSTSNLKIEALVFTRLVLASNGDSVLCPYIKALLHSVLHAVGEHDNGVKAEALRVCEEFVLLVGRNIEVYDFKPCVRQIFEAIRPCLEHKDKYVTDCAIACMARLVCTYSNHGELPNLQVCLSVLMDRMINEKTPLAVVKAFDVITTSPLHINIFCILEQLISKLTLFFQKDTDLSVRQVSLRILKTLIVEYGAQIDSETYKVVVKELRCLISHSDVNIITAPALDICIILVCNGRAHRNILDQLLSSLLSAAQQFTTSDAVSQQALFPIANCVDALCRAMDDEKRLATINVLINNLRDDSSTNKVMQHLLLLCLGEIGRSGDIFSHEHIDSDIIKFFQSPFEQIKSAASYALGNIAVGNLSRYLPCILDGIYKQEKYEYWFLSSLKEMIVRLPELDHDSIKKITNVLFKYCQTKDDRVRTVVAESLGKIALIEPVKLVPALKNIMESSTKHKLIGLGRTLWNCKSFSPWSIMKHFENQAASTRTTVVLALKWSIVEGEEKIDDLLYAEIEYFMTAMKDSDRRVQHACVSVLCRAARYKPGLIDHLLPRLLPLLYDLTEVKKHESIRKKEKRTRLQLRKATFRCLDTLLDNHFAEVDPSLFIDLPLLRGLSDHHDIQRICHIMLSKLANMYPFHVLSVLGLLVNPLQKTLTLAIKQDDQDMIDSALTAVASLNGMRGAKGNPSLKNLTDFCSRHSATFRDTR